MKIRFVLPLFFFLSIAFILWRGLSLHPNEIPSPFINKAAPNMALHSLFDTKRIVQNSDFKNKVTLVNVWATWCYACALEHTMLMRIASDNVVNLMGVDYKDNPISARTWLKEKGNPYQLVALDPAGDAAIDWGVYGTPETFIIDKKGLVRYKHIGPITADVWQQQLKPLIDTLQNEAS